MERGRLARVLIRAGIAALALERRRPRRRDLREEMRRRGRRRSKRLAQGKWSGAVHQ